jgi:hypothetical protein
MKIDRKERGRDGMSWIHMAQERNHLRDLDMVGKVI